MRDELSATLALASFYCRFLWVIGAALYEPFANRSTDPAVTETSWLSRRLAKMGASRGRGFRGR